MTDTAPELLLLHALPLDGAMWEAQMDLLPGATHAPTLYSSGDHIGAWASHALSLTTSNRLIVVGCSVGGSCALEVAALAPDRVAALVLIGTKAVRRDDPTFYRSAMALLEERGLEAAWEEWWGPAFSAKAPAETVRKGKAMAMRQGLENVTRGVDVFHTRPSRDDILSTFPGPVVFVSGADDALPGPKTSAAQAQMARDGHFHRIPDCGHYVPMEKPKALNAILRPLIGGAA